MTDTVTIQMAEIKTDIKYIKKAQDENKIEHKEIKQIIEKFVNKVDESLDKKAEKNDVEFINNRINKAIIYAIITLLTIVGFFVKYTLFN